MYIHIYICNRRKKHRKAAYRVQQISQHSFFCSKKKKKLTENPKDVLYIHIPYVGYNREKIELKNVSAV